MRRAKRNTTKGAASLAAVGAVQIDAEQAGRLARLGLKVNEIGVEAGNKYEQLATELTRINEQLAMVTVFLPRRQRRLVERMTVDHEREKDKDGHGENEDGAKNESEKAGEGKAGVKSAADGIKKKKRASILETPTEVRTYDPEDDSSGVPWQFVGELDTKWSWCMQPRNDMGRDLALAFERLEDERSCFETEMQESFANIEGKLQAITEAQNSSQGGRLRQMRGSGMENEGYSSQLSTTPIPGGMDKMTQRMFRELAPKMEKWEDRFERLVKDLGEVKKAQEQDHANKLDKDEYQMLVLRFAEFEQLYAATFEMRMDAVTQETKHSSQVLANMSDQVRRLDSTAVPRSEIMKLRGEIGSVKSDAARQSKEIQEGYTAIFHANRSLTQTFQEVKQRAEADCFRLETTKIGTTEFTVLKEMVTKIEGSLRDNRQIIENGGQDISAVVKRIILNMEDKIIVNEKKIDAVALHLPPSRQDMNDGSSPRTTGMSERFQRTRTTGGPDTSALQSKSEAHDQALKEVNQELQAVTHDLAHLKQEISLSKVNMEAIEDKAMQNAEIAARLHVTLESAANGQDDGTVLSLERIQVMIAAAARQLVAGSKWVTKDTFDSRVIEIRREYLSGARQLQAHLDDRFSELAESFVDVKVESASAKPKAVTASPKPAPKAPAAAPGQAGLRPTSGRHVVKETPSLPKLLTGKLKVPSQDVADVQPASDMEGELSLPRSARGVEGSALDHFGTTAVNRALGGTLVKASPRRLAPGPGAL